MSFTPKDSAIKVTKSIEDRINAATTQAEIQSILHEASVDQHLTVPDIYDETVLLAVDPGTAPRGFARTVVIAGVKHVLEAASPEELVRLETETYKAALEGRSTTEQTRSTQDDDEYIDAQIDAVSGIEKDLVERYLRAQGVDPEALREVSGQKFQAGWTQATEKFLGTHSDWPGGDANMRVIGERIASSPELLNAEDKAAALDAAYRYAVENNLLVANPETEQAERIANAKTPEEIREALGYRDPSSSVWGGR